jgi:hypothetical protein
MNLKRLSDHLQVILMTLVLLTGLGMMGASGSSACEPSGTCGSSPCPPDERCRTLSVNCGTWRCEFDSMNICVFETGMCLFEGPCYCSVCYPSGPYCPGLGGTGES